MLRGCLACLKPQMIALCDAFKNRFVQLCHWERNGQPLGTDSTGMLNPVYSLLRVIELYYRQQFTLQIF